MIILKYKKLFIFHEEVMLIDNINHKNIYSKIHFSDTSSKANKESSNFVNYIKKELGEISEIQKKATIDSEKFQLNQSDISLNDTMINLQKSAISIQMAIQIRNKIVSAYQEIMNQQI